MNRRTSLILIFSFLLAVIFSIASCQCQDKPKGAEKPPIVKDEDKLLPGEIKTPRYPKAIITAIEDLKCSDSTKCPSRDLNCNCRKFTVQQDTFYYLTASYLRADGDTLHPSCRICSSIYQDTTLILNLVTACPTGGPWVSNVQLKKGTEYTLCACLQKCPNQPKCDCPELASAEAIVSMRRIFD